MEIVLLLDGKQEQAIDASAAAVKMTKTYCTAFYVDPASAPGAASIAGRNVASCSHGARLAHTGVACKQGLPSMTGSL